MRPLKYFLIICSILLCGCNDGKNDAIVTDYYLLTLGNNFDIKKLHYENDSTAFAEEMRRSNDFDKMCMEKLEENVQAMRECEPRTKEYYKAKAFIDAYSSLLKESRILMRIAHAPDYNVDEYIDIVTEKGVYSEESRQYVEKNKIDADFYRIKD